MRSWRSIGCPDPGLTIAEADKRAAGACSHLNRFAAWLQASDGNRHPCMGKREHYFAAIAEYKARFASLPTEKLQARLASGVLYKEAAIAIREILEERAAIDGAPLPRPSGDR